MGAHKSAGTPIDSGILGGRSAGPMVPRLLLGARLRRLREERGVSREDAGHAIRGSRSKISRMEAGRHGFKLRDVEDLLTLYGVTGEAERATLLTLVEESNTPAWWQYFNDVVPAWTQTYLAAEQAASLVRCFEVQRVPVLLQTPDYARASLRLAHPDASPQEIERRAALRISRQRILHRQPHDQALGRARRGGGAAARGRRLHDARPAKASHRDLPASRRSPSRSCRSSPAATRRRAARSPSCGCPAASCPTSSTSNNSPQASIPTVPPRSSATGTP